MYPYLQVRKLAIALNWVAVCTMESTTSTGRVRKSHHHCYFDPCPGYEFHHYDWFHLFSSWPRISSGWTFTTRISSIKPTWASRSQSKGGSIVWSFLWNVVFVGCWLEDMLFVDWAAFIQSCGNKFLFSGLFLLAQVGLHRFVSRVCSHAESHGSCVCGMLPCVCHCNAETARWHNLQCTWRVVAWYGTVLYCQCPVIGVHVHHSKFPRWYRAEDHARTLVSYVHETARSSSKIYDVLDLFGATKRVASTWINSGYNGISYDIKISREHDVCTESGIKCLLGMMLQFPDHVSKFWCIFVGWIVETATCRATLSNWGWTTMPSFVLPHHAASWVRRAPLFIGGAMMHQQVIKGGTKSGFPIVFGWTLYLNCGLWFLLEGPAVYVSNPQPECIFLQFSCCLSMSFSRIKMLHLRHFACRSFWQFEVAWKW